jgi:hypothetical protein
MNRFSSVLNIILLSILFIYLNISSAAEISEQTKPDSQWWKGNLHTHSFWSDGNDFPEMIVSWYAENGYNFLALSDHNILSVGDKWIEFPNRGGIIENAYQKYLAKFGLDWVETEDGIESGQKVRLKPLNEFRSLFESPGRFLLMQSEEITAQFINIPVHLNATNLYRFIAPKSGKSVREVIQNNVDAVYQQRQEIGRPILVHVNHPNFGWALTAKDIALVKNEKFFEVYNGHPAVRNYGDQDHISTEKMWDQILTHRLTNGTGEIIYGIATDDAHNYHQYQMNKSNPGRGWVMVKATHLSAESIIKAMENGNFYASTGVKVKSIEIGQTSYRIEITPEDGTTFTTQFVGTTKKDILNLEDFDSQKENSKNDSLIGKVLAVKQGVKVQYDFNGDELYVRAKVISSKKKKNPYSENELETAWLQPIELLSK